MKKIQLLLLQLFLVFIPLQLLASVEDTGMDETTNNVVIREAEWNGETIREFALPGSVFMPVSTNPLAPFILEDKSPKFIKDADTDKVVVIFEMQGQKESIEGRLHTNGGGFVALTADVVETVYVGKNAMVLGEARIKDQVKILDRARVFNEVQISDQVVVSDSALVFGKAELSGEVKVSGNSRVSGLSKVSEQAQITDNAQVFSTAEVSGQAKIFGDAKVFKKVKGKKEVSQFQYDTVLEGPGVSESDRLTLEKNESNYVVKVTVKFKDKPIMNPSTGFFIDNKTVVTAFHSLQNLLKTPDAYLSIEDHSGQLIKLVKIRQLSALDDLAILEIEEKERLFLQLASSRNELRDVVHLLGFPWGNYTQFLRATGSRKVSKLVRDNKRTLGAIFPYGHLGAFSGGPVLNNEGHVVGILKTTTQGWTENFKMSVGRATHVDFLNQLLEKSPLSLEDPTSLVRQEFNRMEALAHRGDVDAQFYLMMFHFELANFFGDQKESNQRAFFWAKKAAEQGHAQAQLVLAVMYFRGQGVEKSFIKSLRWRIKGVKSSKRTSANTCQKVF